MVETVAPRLVGRVPVVTLHDAIYSTLPSLATIEAAFNDTFDAIGCRLPQNPVRQHGVNTWSIWPPPNRMVSGDFDRDQGFEDDGLPPSRPPIAPPSR